MAVLIAGSVVTFLLGCYSAFIAFILVIVLGMTPSSSYETGEYEKYELILVLLFPGPLAALIIAWVGYGVLRGLKHPKPALAWFTVFVGGWLLVFLLWLGPEMAFPLSGSFFNRGKLR